MKFGQPNEKVEFIPFVSEYILTNDQIIDLLKWSYGKEDFKHFEIILVQELIKRTNGLTAEIKNP